ncbi:MAG: diguanylate cyclase domain-containing protein, partial [Hydrogenovibrio sp.]
MSLNNTRHDLNCDYLHQDLHAFKEENTRLIEQLMALEEQFEVMEQRISELETEALISQQIESNDASMQKQFALLFDESPAPMLLTNQHGDIEMLNQAACRMLHQSCDIALGQNFRKFLQKQSAYDLVLLLRDSEHSTEKVQGQKVFVLKSNDIFTLSLVRLNHPGRYGGYYLMSPMMVNLKEVSSQSLRLSNIIIDQIREGLMVTDAKGQIIRINQAFSEITGFSPADVEDKTPAILHSGRHSKRFYDDMWLEIQHHGWWCGEIWNRRKSGEVYPEWLQISRIHDQQTGQVFYVATFSDITDRKAYQGQLDRLAFYDALTGLPNRSLLNQFLETQLIHLQEKADRMLAVLFLDLDKFKDVNDHYGHAEGDYVLREATQRIMARLGESDMASRIGGDEFVMVLTRITAVEEAIDITRDLLNLLSDPFNTPKSAHRLSASIGIALAPL